MLLDQINGLILEVEIARSREISRKATSKRFKSLINKPTWINAKRLSKGVSTVLKVEAKHLVDKANIIKKNIGKDSQDALDQTAKGVVSDAANVATGVGKKISKGFSAGLNKYKDEVGAGKSKLDAFGSGLFRGGRVAVTGVPDKKTGISAARLATMASGWKGSAAVLGTSALYHTIKKAKENGTFSDLDNKVDVEQLKKRESFRKKKEEEKAKDTPVLDKVANAITATIKKAGSKSSEPKDPEDKAREEGIKSNSLAIDTFHSRMQNVKPNDKQTRQKHLDDLTKSINMSHLTPDHKDYLRQTGILEHDSTYI